MEEYFVNPLLAARRGAELTVELCKNLCWLTLEQVELATSTHGSLELGNRNYYERFISIFTQKYFVFDINSLVIVEW